MPHQRPLAYSYIFEYIYIYRVCVYMFSVWCIYTNSTCTRTIVCIYMYSVCVCVYRVCVYMYIVCLCVPAALAPEPSCVYIYV